jgi:hypothetical protein
MKMFSATAVVLFLAIGRISAPSAALALETGSSDALRSQANVMIEIVLAADGSYRDAQHDVTLDVVFADPRGGTLKVPAFWAGGQTWKVRYASPLFGPHGWRSVCSVTTDHGLHGRSGTIRIEPYRGDNPLYTHGPLRVAADKRHFGHADGTPFFWLGDTWWMGLCRRLHWPDEFQQLAADRKAKGFNVIQIVAGLYPDMPAFDPRGANEAGFPWEKDYARIRSDYFDKADQRLFYLVEQGFTPCIVGAWGYHLPWMGTERIKEHWRYLIARYGALPVVWCAAGEGTMPYYLSKHPKEDRTLQKEGWTEVIRYIRATDPFHRMITIHPSESARSTVSDPSLLDFDMLQTGHASENLIGRVAQHVSLSYKAQPTMPVLSGESSYDALDLRHADWGAGLLTTDDSRKMFWVCLMRGGVAGGTYGANGIWQLNRRDAPYGPSPSAHSHTYGSIPWDKAMHLPSSTQAGLAKRFFANYPWYLLKPCSETVDWGDAKPSNAKIRPSAVATGPLLRIVYVPYPLAIVAEQLAPKTEYTVIRFDPVTGVRSAAEKMTTDAKGTLRSPPPDYRHDWVVVLERQGV